MKRYQRLDVLRFVAAITILLHHVPDDVVAHLTIGRTIMEWFLRVGWVSVDLFFVVSGFLVSGLLFDEFQRTRRINVRRFLIRRGLKIYPAYYFFLTVTWWMGISGKHDRLVAAVFLWNYLPGNIHFSHLWSLSIEEHFYLLLALYAALAFRLSPRNPWRGLLSGIAVLCALELVLRVAHFVSAPFELLYFYLPTHLRLDGLLAGMALAWVFRFRRHWLDRTVGAYPWCTLGIALILLLPTLGTSRFATPYWTVIQGFTTNAIGFSLVIALCFYLPPIPGRTAAALARGTAFVGRHSYGIYLWHRFAMFVITPRLLTYWNLSPSRANPAISILIAVLFGIAMSLLIENPVLRVREYLWPKPALTVPSPAASLACDYGVRRA